MARKPAAAKPTSGRRGATTARAGRPSALVDTRIIYCGDCLDQLAKLPDACVDLIYIDPPFNSNGNYEVFWAETKEERILNTICLPLKRKRRTFDRNVQCDPVPAR